MHMIWHDNITACRPTVTFARVAPFIYQNVCEFSARENWSPSENTSRDKVNRSIYADASEPVQMLVFISAPFASMHHEFPHRPASPMPATERHFIIPALAAPKQ